MPNYIDKITNASGTETAEIRDKALTVLETAANAGKLVGISGNQTLTAVDREIFATVASPTFTGTPKAPTAATGTNSTQIATTAFVQTELSSKAPLASPTFTGIPEAPTATTGTNTTQIATTAFVNKANNIFIATYQQTTYNDVAQAWQAGKDIIAFVDVGMNYVAPYYLTRVGYQGNDFIFRFVRTNKNEGATTTYACVELTSSGWSSNVTTVSLAELASPTFTGTPKAPTASAGTNTTQIATTAFVNTAITNANNIFIATYGTTTYADISAAESAGKILFATRTNSGVTRCLPLIEKNAGGQYIFSGEYSGTNVYYTVNSSSNWSETTYALAAYSHSHTNYVTKAYTAGNASNYEVRYAKFLPTSSDGTSVKPDALNKIIWFYE